MSLLNVPPGKVLVIAETTRQRIAAAAITLALIVGVIGTDSYLSSPAMQWLGFLMLLLAALLRVADRSRAGVTPQEAADLLRRDYGVVADGYGLTTIRHPRAQRGGS